MPVSASCHCGAVKLELARKPTVVTECNCSVCRRYGARWAYCSARSVTFNFAPTAVKAYSWGDRCIDFVHCRTCGCLTHYVSRDGDADGRMAVNARMLDPTITAGLRVRMFDGADSWKYIT